MAPKSTYLGFLAFTLGVHASPWGPWHGHDHQSACGYAGGGPTATIDAGVVIGTTTSLPAATGTVNKYLGVPFAKTPPTRFAPPESAPAFSEPLMATEWSPACIQQFMYPRASYEFTQEVFNNPPPAESEDCLYLNVYAPSTPAPADGRAVMFWIYGGSLQFGNAGQYAYDGECLLLLDKMRCRTHIVRHMLTCTQFWNRKLVRRLRGRHRCNSELPNECLWFSQQP